MKYNPILWAVFTSRLKGGLRGLWPQEDLNALIDYCDGLLCHVNLIPLNSIPGSPFKPVSQQAMNHWADALEAHRIPVSIRKSRGSDIAAACGQLAAEASHG